MNRRSLLLAPLLALSLMGAGCFGTSNTATAPDGGVFRTRDDAAKWEQPKVLNLDTQIGSIAAIGTTVAALDPQDPGSIYVGTTENGLMYTWNSGASWQLAHGLSNGKISSVVVDTKDKCTVYATRNNQIQKTTTCGREWSAVWSHPRAETLITSIAIDWYNPKTLYIGTSEGDILRSDDGAISWRPMHRTEGSRVNDVKVDPKDSRVVYVAMTGSGMLKSADAGATWIEIRKQFEPFQGARTPKFLVLDPTVRDRIYQVSKFGLLVSDDGAVNWRAVTLPTASQTTEVTAFTVNPKDPNTLVYTTASAIVMSKDGGTSWSSKKLPTVRGVSWLLYNNEVPPALLLGVAPAKK